MRYQHVDALGQVRTGQCRAISAILADKTIAAARTVAMDEWGSVGGAVHCGGVKELMSQRKIRLSAQCQVSKIAATEFYERGGCNHDCVVRRKRWSWKINGAR